MLTLGILALLAVEICLVSSAETGLEYCSSVLSVSALSSQPECCFYAPTKAIPDLAEYCCQKLLLFCPESGQSDDILFEDSERTPSIANLKGHCIVEKTSKILLKGIKTKTECLKACQANEIATGCQFRKAKKKCKAVTGSFEKASGRSGVVCWMFNVIKDVFPNMTNTRGREEFDWLKCGTGKCRILRPICCPLHHQGNGGCCKPAYPHCASGSDTCRSNVPMDPHPTFILKHVIEAKEGAVSITYKEVEEFCKRRNFEPIASETNTVFVGEIINKGQAKDGWTTTIIRGSKYCCARSRYRNWYCNEIVNTDPERIWSAKHHTVTGHLHSDDNC